MNNIKIILLGNTAVGKTSLITQFADHYFLEECTGSYSPIKYRQSIEIYYNKLFDLEILDTVGKNKIMNSNYSFMKNTNICLLIYDITNQNSFYELHLWYNFMNEVNNVENVFFVVVGNKSDLYEDQVISKETGEEYANNIGALFFETKILKIYLMKLLLNMLKI